MLAADRVGSARNMFSAKRTQFRAAGADKKRKFTTETRRARRFLGVRRARSLLRVLRASVVNPMDARRRQGRFGTEYVFCETNPISRRRRRKKKKIHHGDTESTEEV